MADMPHSGPHNEDVAAAFDEMAELLSIRGENPFRIRAYQRAAQVIRTLPQPLTELHGTQAFDELPGIGSDLAGKIEELLSTGKLRVLEQLRRQVPTGLRELLRLPALGPIRVRALNVKLGVCNLDDLRKALEGGRLAGVRGFGPVIRARLQKALTTEVAAQKRWPWSTADEYARALRTYLLSIRGVTGLLHRRPERRRAAAREPSGGRAASTCAPLARARGRPRDDRGMLDR